MEKSRKTNAQTENIGEIPNTNGDDDDDDEIRKERKKDIKTFTTNKLKTSLLNLIWCDVRYVWYLSWASIFR